MVSKASDMISRWLIEETFTLRRLEAPPEARIKWGINVSTPGSPGVSFTIVNPADREDRYVLTLAILVSPEHLKELEKLKPADRLKIMHSILSRALAVCIDCKIMVQPNVLNPQAIVVNMDVFEDEVTSYGKGFFLRTVWRLINTYLSIVSGFNEWMPILPPEAGRQSTQTFI